MNNHIARNEALYNIKQWGAGYFHINASGNLVVTKTASDPPIELQTVVNQALDAGLELPLLIRFTDILSDRVIRIEEAFKNAIANTQYSAHYQLVYPIKVNQAHNVVNILINTPNQHLGLEAGSKPELMAVVGVLGKRRTTIVCNGYKDRSYIRAALIAQQMGHQVYIIVEKLFELSTILQEAASMRIKPCLGARLRLATVCAGKWADTGGTKSKFGLTSEQTLELIEELKRNQAIDYLQLIHCHLGSQVANIDDIKKSMREISQYYISLRQYGAPINTIDVGGGLAIDYAGTFTSTDCSMNYSLDDYANAILSTLRELCLASNTPEPNIISESGRAVTAHHAVLITNITDIEYSDTNKKVPSLKSNSSSYVQDIYAAYQTMKSYPAMQLYQYADEFLLQANTLFEQGKLSILEKINLEKLHTAICHQLLTMLNEQHEEEAALKESLHVRLADKVFCNLSFFQSIPDAWAVGQIFPVTPLSHLNQAVNRHSVLHDLTCDSDGSIKQYTGAQCVQSTLLLPAQTKVPFHLAIFLVGAYQEILGNLHNLFGDTNSIDVELSTDGQFKINRLIRGDSITQVLKMANYDSKTLLKSYETQLNSTSLPNDIKHDYLHELKVLLEQLTYLNGEC